MTTLRRVREDNSTYRVCLEGGGMVDERSKACIGAVEFWRMALGTLVVLDTGTLASVLTGVVA